MGERNPIAPELPGPATARPSLRRGRNLVLFIGLLGFWLVLVGTIDAQRLISGAFVSALLVAIWSRRLQTGPAEADVPLLQLFVQPGILRYLGHMAVEIVKANWSVARIVLSRDMPISPTFVLIKTKLHHNLTRVIYANSITITPGTISVNLSGDELIIHAITWDAAMGVRGWVIEDYIEELESAWAR